MNSMQDILARINLLEGKGSKPDFLDLDKDGDKTEPMKKASKEVDESVEEGSTGDYSAKKARAGKDIGKPGKQFAKIAKSAGERYGSKERGEKVAGAVLAKLRKGAAEGVETEGNLFTGNLAKARAAGKKQADLDGDGDMEKVRESKKPMAVVFETTYKGRQVKVIHDSEFNEFTIDMGAHRVFAEDKDSAANIAKAWLDEGKVLWPGTSEYQKKFGHEMRSGEKRRSSTGGEIEKTDTGIRHTARAYDDEEETKADDGAPKRRGRPKGSKRALGAKGPTGRSKLLSKGAIREADLEEDYDQDEYDEEGEMAKSQSMTIADAAHELQHMLTDTENLPEWVQKKITLAQEYIDSARDYLKANRPEAEMDESALQAYLGKKKYGASGMKALQQAGREGASKEKMAKIRAQHDKLDEVDLEEKAVSRAQQRFMGMAHAMQKGEKIPGASKELKKVARGMKKGDVEDFAKTKHKGLPEKVKAKKEESVEETTTAGSVATAPVAAPKGKKGMIFGKGVYEGKLEESYKSRLEQMLTEGMSVNMSMNQDGTKSLSVNATDEDADKLAQIIQLAGMEQTSGYEEACPACGQSPCACEELEEADLANAPEPEYSDTDTMVNTLSGGLNARKTTGQTTMPVINRDPARQGVSAVAEEIREQQESRLWNLYKKYSTK